MAVPADVAKTDLPSLQLLPAFRSASAAVTCRDSWPSSGTAAGAPAIEVPGLGALNTGGAVEDVSVACGSAGSCVAGGGYTNGGRQGFVAVERHGRWGRDRGARPGSPERGQVRWGYLAVLLPGGQVRGRRVLLRRPP